MIIENQLESSKKSIMLGFSKKYTLYDSGCLVHCVARLLELPVLEVHEKLKSCGCFIADNTGDVCLLDLAKVPNAYPQLKYVGKVTTWNQQTALDAINQAGGLIVGVDYNPNLAGIQSHFVFFHGNGEMEDPLGGVVRKTSYYTVVSMRIFELDKNYSTTSNENTNYDSEKALELISALKEKMGYGNLEGTVNALIGLISEKENLVESLSGKSAELEKALSEVSELTSKLSEEQKNNKECQTQLATASEILGNIEEDLVTAATEKVAADNRYKNKNDEFNAMKYMVAQYPYLLNFAILKLKGKSLDDYLTTELPKVIKIITS